MAPFPNKILSINEVPDKEVTFRVAVGRECPKLANKVLPNFFEYIEDIYVKYFHIFRINPLYI